MTQRTWQVVFLLAVFVLVLYIAYLLRAVFIPLLIAMILAYILNPLVTKLEEKKVPRIASIGSIYGIFLIAFALIVLIAIPAAVRQGVEFVQVTFVGVEGEPPKIEGVLKAGATKLEELTGTRWEDVNEELKKKLPDHAGDVTSAVAWAAATLGSLTASGLGAVLAALSFLVLIPVYCFFFLRGMNSGWERFKEWLPEKYRDRIAATLVRIHNANSAFFRGQITICLIDGAILFLVLLVMGVKFSFLFGVL
ncbi:MAG: AI-2E family transporter, partial [Planctomycetota bacterium]